MSHQALNKDNYNVFIQFDRTTELITELIFALLDRNNKSLNIASVINNNINNEINHWRFTFDIPTEIGIQNDMEKTKNIKRQKKNTNTTSPYVPPPLLKAEQIDIERNKANEDFIKTAMQMNKDELNAANESADQKK